MINLSTDLTTLTISDLVTLIIMIPPPYDALYRPSWSTGHEYTRWILD